MNPCRWVWSGSVWGEDPMYPHTCGLGQECAYPALDGVFIGQVTFTQCI